MSTGRTSPERCIVGDRDKVQFLLKEVKKNPQGIPFEKESSMADFRLSTGKKIREVMFVSGSDIHESVRIRSP